MTPGEKQIRAGAEKELVGECSDGAALQQGVQKGFPKGLSSFLLKLTKPKANASTQGLTPISLMTTGLLALSNFLPPQQRNSKEIPQK